jgi:chromosomal replication initiator protein
MSSGTFFETKCKLLDNRNMVPNVWDDFLAILKEEAGSNVVETWFKAVLFHKWDASNNTVYLEAPNPFVRDWIKSNYMQLVQMHIGRLLHVNMPHIILIDAKEKNGVEEQSIISSSTNICPIMMVPAKVLANRSRIKEVSSKSGCHINSAYSFDSFIVGPNNSLAYAASHAVAEHPGLVYNPLFIYGCSGLGKTHLLHAIGNEIKKRDKRVVIVYQTIDRFVNEFINAIRFDRVHAFNEKYKNAHVLLIDDIQFISNKEQTQEAFFHIFNCLYDSHKQIVFSSDTMPNDIKGLAERLQSRLSCGLVADIQIPSLETKIAILKKKAELQGELLSDDVAHFIASRVISNIRELEGALIRVMAFALLTKQSVSLELAKKVLVRPGDSNPQKIDFLYIVKTVNKQYPYSLDELRSKSRNKDLSFVRHLLMFLMKKMTGKSLRDIGTFLGGRDHSTVLNGIKKMEDYIEAHPEFREKMRRIEINI